MKITILTVMPQLFDSFLKNKAYAAAEVVDIRDYTKGSFRDIDDSPYGGGPGMILRVDALMRALNAVKTKDAHIVLLSPRGTPYNKETAERLSQKQHLILVCGHYEGVDERFLSYVDEEISVGDYILTGGELPAMLVTDSILSLQERK